MTYGCSCLIAGFGGLKIPTEGMDIRLLCLLFVVLLRRADRSFRGVLPVCVCVCVYVCVCMCVYVCVCVFVCVYICV